MALAGPPRRRQKWRVLIVDDNRALASTLAECVATKGHEVSVASNGKEAVECFRETEFDIAFMDVQMPVMNGIDSFYEIRKMRPGARVVFMTGTPEPNLHQLLRSGALGLLLKPFGTPALLALLQGVVTPAVLQSPPLLHPLTLCQQTGFVLADRDPL